MAYDVLGLLAQQMPSESDYLGSNPFYNAGRGISQIQVQPRTSSEAIWQPMLQGLLAGGIGGYGQRQARQSQFADTQANPFIKSQLSNPSALEMNPGLSAYLSETAPESWSPKQARTDVMTSLLMAQNLQEQQAKNAEIAAALKAKIDEATNPAINAAKVKQEGDIAAVREAATAPSKAAAKKIEDAKKEEDLAYSRITGLASYKNVNDIAPNFKTLVSLKDNEDAAAAPAMITSFNRILDPNSTTREGEYKTISNNVQSMLDKIQGDWRAAAQGKTSLSKAAREAMVKIAAEKTNAFASQYTGERDTLIADAVKKGGAAANIPAPEFTPYGITPQQALINSLKARGVDKATAQRLFSEKFPNG